MEGEIADTRTADAKRWDSIWSDRDGSNDWDYLSEVILNVLSAEAGDLAGKTVLEAGSGSGRISLRLAERAAGVTLLDYSATALEASRERFLRKGLAASFVRADIHDIETAVGKHDIVWNAGVLEHYDYAEQGVILRKLLAVCKESGTVIMFNPNARSLIYMLGKYTLAAFGRWPFGKEYPIASIRDIDAVSGGGYTIKEYPIGFIVSFVDAYKFLPAGLQRLKIVRAVSRIFIGASRRLAGADKVLSKIFGGYLLVSVLKKGTA